MGYIEFKKQAEDASSNGAMTTQHIYHEYAPTGQDMLALERMHRLQAESSRRRSRAAREALGIQDYNALQSKLSWANTLGVLKHMAAGGLAGAGIGALAGAGYGSLSREGAAGPTLGGAVAGGLFIGPMLGLLLAGIKGARGDYDAHAVIPTKEDIIRDYEDIRKRRPGDIGIYDASRFSSRLSDYLQDNTGKDNELQSYAF